MSLEEAFDDSLAYANFLIENVSAARSVGTIGEVCVELSGYYRALGICELLLDCDVDAFFHSLIQGALTRKYYLARCVQEGQLDQPERRATILGPMFDSIAANQFGLAGEIASMASSFRWEDFEDDIDFAYAGVIHALVSPLGVGSSILSAALDAYEVVLEGQNEERLSVCRALERHEEQVFAESFLLLLDAHEEQMVNLKSSIRSNESTYAPNCFIFVEGLALLRIAERAGLKTQREYPLCPSLARLSTYSPFVPSSFPNLVLNP